MSSTNAITDFSKEAFIALALSSGVLKFGTFCLKSGRESPYFFNMGLLYEGQALRRIGGFYANKLMEEKIKPEHLFGPAYKGISLATTTAIALAERGISTQVSFNRKEVKTHGEKGQLIGAPLDGRDIIMIDDVITAGTAFREAQKIIRDQGGRLTTVIIALDRCEPGPNNHQSAISEIASEGIRVLSLVTVYDVVEYLKKSQAFEEARLLEDYLKG